MFDDLNVYLCMCIFAGFRLVHLLLVVPSPQKFMFKRVSNTMEPRGSITLVDRMFHNL